MTGDGLFFVFVIPFILQNLPRKLNEKYIIVLLNELVHLLIGDLILVYNKFVQKRLNIFIIIKSISLKNNL